VGGTPTLGSDCSLCLGIHRRESAGSLSTRTARIPRLHSALSSRAAYGGAISAPRSVATSASLVHHIPVVVGLVCHYPSPAANFRVGQSGCSTSVSVSDEVAEALAAPALRFWCARDKPQFSGEDVSTAPSGRNVDFFFSPTCVRLMIKGSAAGARPGRARRRVCVTSTSLRSGPRGRRRVVNPVRGRE
jgi:hypothetical protein